MSVRQGEAVPAAASLLRRFDWTVDAEYRDRLNYHSLPFPADGQPVDLRPLERTPTV